MEKSTEERERSIQSGAHYSEMLPIEYKPTESYMDLFYESLKESKEKGSRSCSCCSRTDCEKARLPNGALQFG
ncbi:cysteine protease StiP domain-containing protein [Bacillus sp. SL00103]